MKICIHRGANQIGGSCVELECGNSRIVLDIGLPLNVVSPDDVGLPDVPGFTSLDPSLLGVIISHPHQDHYGLVSRIRKDIPILIGAAAQRILEMANLFTGNKVQFSNVIHLENEKQIDIGPFTITPFLMDHSAYDSYPILVEADNKKLFYTGDLRAHGRKGSLFHKLMSNPPVNVDVLLMEGTTISRVGIDESFPTESDVENELLHLFKSTKGIALVHSSTQNIDRTVSIFRACKRSGRILIIDLYAAAILDATGNSNIPQSDWPEVALLIPQQQRIQIKQNEWFKLLKEHSSERIFIEELRKNPERYTLLFRPIYCADLKKANCITGANYIYSMWEGYWEHGSYERLRSWLEQNSIHKYSIHTSGHADQHALKNIVNAFSPRKVVPIHTVSPGRYSEFFSNVELHNDGEWWEV
jgi:ribonuclease J